MLLVRKTLTEILKEVTDEKIQEISKETLSRYQKKGSCTNSILPMISLSFLFNTQKVIFKFFGPKSRRFGELS